MFESTKILRHTSQISIDAGNLERILAKFLRTELTVTKIYIRNRGYIYQDYSLFPEFTAYENVVMPILIDGKKPDENEVDDLLEELGISHCKNKFPSQMSGGEQQRVAIARALITHPAVILADEPTGNLDAGSAGTVAQMLSKASQKHNQTIIMVTHDRQMADYADKIITIVDGVCQ